MKRERKINRETSYKNREQQMHSIKKVVSSSDSFFKKPVVKGITKTIAIGSVVFGALYISKYFFSATAKMIRSFKEVRDACKE